MIEAASFWELVERRAAETPDGLLALDERGRTLSFVELHDRGLRVAAGLAALGIERDQVVSWMLPTRISALVLMSALARLGAVQNPLIPIYREREMRFCTEQTGARWLLVPGSFRGVDFTAMAHEIAAGRALEVVDISKSLPEGDPSKMDFGDKPELGGAKAWKDIWGSGQGIGAVKDVLPTAELVARLKKEYAAAWQRLNGQVSL